MRFELNKEGRFVLCGVSADAWEEIQREREEHGSPEHFCFGRENRDGTVYVTATPYEDKTDLIRIMEKFIVRFDMKVDRTTEYVYAAWSRDAKRARATERENARKDAAKRLIDGLKRTLRDGCAGCSYFRTERCGDDINGYCTAIGKTPLQASPLSFDGENRHGVQFMGMKFYPCDECIYLKYKEEVA